MAFRNRRFQAGRRRRFTPRRSTFRRRSFRNGRSRTTRRYSRPRTNVRRVRNLASRKCRDNMICTPIDDTGTPQTPGPVSMDASSVYGFIFSPTARTAGTQLESGERVNAPSSAQRRKSKCYVRGYGETVEIQTDDASPWVWRRIVFSTIGLASQFDPGLLYNNDETRGWGRSLFNIRSGTQQASILEGVVFRYLFQGTEGVDWANVMTATTAPRHVRVYSDRRRVIQSPNSEGGTIRLSKHYDGINRSIIYDDVEIGAGAKATNAIASGTPYGNMGDLFVLDFFSSASDDETSGASFQPHGKFYWHEGQSA
ncbi:capsid protein [Bovine associated gemykibivirus 1]|uniref:Capsid protein n=1 Tax=Bovine associated gemykibivirus 1 TaxID=2004486 RepID=A0A077XLV7_9VIRU|nr:capsid protein [HCBI8.215 virus]CDS63382.1 capsid protein [HCBI8.215 virus]